MKTARFAIKEILPNPFRRIEKYPLVPAKIEDLTESIETTGFWENVVIRINAQGKPELTGGHHRLATLKKMYPGTQQFDWIVVAATDAKMVQMMARENGDTYKHDASVIRETIRAAVEAYGAGKISEKEMPVDAKTNASALRYAPSFLLSGPSGGPHPYTVDSLARFLGTVKPETQKATNGFVAAFGSIELIEEGYLTEARIAGLEPRKLGEVVAAVRTQRNEQIAEAKRLEAQAEERRQAAVRAQAALKEQQERTAQRLADAETAKQKERIVVEARQKEKQQREELAKANAAAAAKASEAAQETKAAKAQVRAVASRLVDEAKTMNRDDIRARGRELGREESVKTGRPVAETATVDEDAVKAFLRDLKQGSTLPRRGVQKVPSDVVKLAKELVESGYKELAKKKHPDHGGSQRDMQLLNAAIAWIRALLVKEETK
jgi:hypothetical protein